ACRAFSKHCRKSSSATKASAGTARRQSTGSRSTTMALQLHSEVAPTEPSSIKNINQNHLKDSQEVMLMSLAHLPRQSILNDRHRANGADLDSVSWNNMPLPQTYQTDPYFETEAVRCRAGLFDVSSLQIINVSGPDALKLLNYMLTSDVSKA